jgi:hypothetical protein
MGRNVDGAKCHGVRFDGASFVGASCPGIGALEDTHSCLFRSAFTLSEEKCIRTRASRSSYPCYASKYVFSAVHNLSAKKT